MNMYLIIVLAAVAAAIPLEPRESEITKDRLEIEAIPTDEISKDTDISSVSRLRTDPFIIQKGRGELLKVPTTYEHVPLVTEFSVPVNKFGLPRSGISSPGQFALLKSPAYLGGPTFVFSGSDGSGINPTLLQSESSSKPSVSQITVINNPLFPQFALVAGGTVIAQPFPEYVYERPKEERPSRPSHPPQEKPIPPQPERPTHERPNPVEPLPERPIESRPGGIRDSDFYTTSHGPQVPIPGQTHFVQGGYSIYDYPSLPATFGSEIYRPFPNPYLSAFVLVSPDGKPLDKTTLELPKREEPEVKPLPGVQRPLILA